MATSQQPAAPAGQRAGSNQQADAERPARRLASSPAVGFIPWILFWVIGGPSTWETATIAALVAAILLMGLSLDLGSRAARSAAVPGQPRAPVRAGLSHLKVLDVATVLFFAGMTVAALVTSRHDVTVLDRYTQVISSGALGIIALGSIMAGRPFTTDYAREQAPREYWHTALFRRINMVLTGAWAAVFLICAGLGFWAAQTPVKGLRDWLNWYIPIALIFLAFRFTSWYPSQVRPSRAAASR